MGEVEAQGWHHVPYIFQVLPQTQCAGQPRPLCSLCVPTVSFHPGVGRFCHRVVEGYANEAGQEGLQGWREAGSIRPNLFYVCAKWGRLAQGCVGEVMMAVWMAPGVLCQAQCCYSRLVQPAKQVWQLGQPLKLPPSQKAGTSDSPQELRL